MRLRLAMSPWWVQGLVHGAFFGAVMTAFARYRTGSWTPALLGGLLGGLLFGVAMGRYMTKLNRALLTGLGDLSPADRRSVLRGSWRGPVPADPEQREAARALLRRRRDHLQASLRRSVVVFAAAIVLYVVLALTQTWLWWFAAAVFLGFLVMTLTSVPRMDRRLALFDSTADAPPRPG